MHVLNRLKANDINALKLFSKQFKPVLLCVFICLYACMCVCVYVYACMCICVYVCMRVRVCPFL